VPEELDFAPAEIGGRAAGFAMPPGFVRLSVGAEAADDVLDDVARGLAALT
jgi:cystathionine beta-lyase/cystathionine gamma-synthase